MPLIRIDVMEGRSAEYLRRLLDATHEAVCEAFEVVSRDRYQIVTEHGPGRMILLDTGLGFERGQHPVVVQVFTSPRTQAMKLKFYETLTRKLETVCGLAPSDLVMSIMTNAREDWSFGFGKAQYLTGEL